VGAGYNRALRKQGGGTDENFRAQSNLESFVAPISKSIILNGVLVEDVILTTSSTAIEHKLGRKPRGYIICKNNATTSVYTPVASTSPELFENLAASASCTVSIWFF